jgi:alkylhydroperoxidase/carboxymuconolactone decarboxylase family protein YurZ
MSLPAPTTDAVTALDPMFGQMYAATTAHAWAIPQLTDREKTFLCLVADVCQSNLGQAFELHVRTGLAHCVSTADIRALLRFVSYDSGYQAALDALARLAEIEPEASLPETALLAEELTTTGPGAAPSPLPEPVRAQLRDLDPNFAEYFDLQSRMRTPAGPGTLSVRERAFTTMSIDVHYQTLDETFRIHTSRALGAGASHDDVRAVLRFIAQFGATRTWRAWIALNAHLGTEPVSPDLAS